MQAYELLVWYAHITLLHSLEKIYYYGTVVWITNVSNLVTIAVGKCFLLASIREFCAYIGMFTATAAVFTVFIIICYCKVISYIDA